MKYISITNMILREHKNLIDTLSTLELLTNFQFQQVAGPKNGLLLVFCCTQNTNISNFNKKLLLNPQIVTILRKFYLESITFKSNVFSYQLKIFASYSLIFFLP